MEPYRVFVRNDLLAIICQDVKEITLEDPYIRVYRRLLTFFDSVETAVRLGKPKRICLITNFDDDAEQKEGMTKLSIVSESLKQYDVQLEVQINPHLHDREIRLGTGWTVKIGRGLTSTSGQMIG